MLEMFLLRVSPLDDVFQRWRNFSEFNAWVSLLERLDRCRLFPRTVEQLYKSDSPLGSLRRRIEQRPNLIDCVAQYLARAPLTIPAASVSQHSESRIDTLCVAQPASEAEREAEPECDFEPEARLESSAEDEAKVPGAKLEQVPGAKLEQVAGAKLEQVPERRESDEKGPLGIEESNHEKKPEEAMEETLALTLAGLIGDREVRMTADLDLWQNQDEGTETSGDSGLELEVHQLLNTSILPSFMSAIKHLCDTFQRGREDLLEGLREILERHQAASLSRGAIDKLSAFVSQTEVDLDSFKQMRTAFD